jgi:hypothetical protein
MKFLKNYEDQTNDRRLKTIERYKKAMTALTFDESIIYIKNYCTEWIKTPFIVIRGLRVNLENSLDYFISDPVKRYSRDNANFYTMIMDNAPKWKYYPKRSNSFCCGTKYNDVGNKSYIVIPKDNSLWGIAPKSDLWNAFDKTIEKYNCLDINEFFMDIDDIAIQFDIELSDENYKIFGEKINLLQEKIQKLSNEEFILLSKTPNLNKWILEMIIKSDNFFQTILNDMNPDEFELLNWYKSAKYLQNIDKDLYPNRELWTESTCLFIEYTIDNVKNLNKNLNINIEFS